MINRFKINQLYGTVNVDIPFNSSGINVFIGENGLGKTTVLNILYYLLTKNYRKLSQFEFGSVELYFGNNDYIKIEFKDLQNAFIFETEGNIPRHLVRDIIDDFGENDLATLYTFMQSKEFSKESLLHHPVIRKNKFAKRYPSGVLFNVINTLFNEDLSKILLMQGKKIENALKDLRILYFPTYRRIEEDLKNLNLEIDEEGKRNQTEKLIQFGMDDVKRRFRLVQDEIQKLSSNGLSKISSEILSQLIKGTPEISNYDYLSTNLDNIKIILSRVGSALTNEDKNRILDKLTTSSIQTEDRFLIYFIQKLIEIYEKQKFLDEKIKKFVIVCNKYLSSSNKELIYNESEVEFYINSSFYSQSKPLSDFLNKLSSGEKQIISLFSKIYLSYEDENYIILFDEPELSLSVFWQEILLPDIIDSGRCKTLIAVTHSPFIYDNSLREYVTGLGKYFNVERLF